MHQNSSFTSQIIAVCQDVVVRRWKQDVKRTNTLTGTTNEVIESKKRVSGLIGSESFGCILTLCWWWVRYFTKLQLLCSMAGEIFHPRLEYMPHLCVLWEVETSWLNLWELTEFSTITFSLIFPFT